LYFVTKCNRKENEALRLKIKNLIHLKEIKNEMGWDMETRNNSDSKANDLKDFIGGITHLSKVERQQNKNKINCKNRIY